MLLLVILYLLTLTVFVRIIFLNLKKNSWSVFSYFSIYLSLFYLISPVISIIVFGLTNDNIKGIVYRVPNYSTNQGLLYSTYFVILIGLISFMLGYKYQLKFKLSKIKNKYLGKYHLDTTVILFLTFLSCISLYLYVRGFGSLKGAIINANLVRSGFYKELESGSTTHTFFFRFIFLALIPIFYFFFKKRNRTFYINISFIISVCILFVLYIFLSPGRQSIIDLILIFVFVPLIKAKKIGNIKLVIFAVLALFFLPLLEAYFKTKTFTNIEFDINLKQIFINEFGFPNFSLMYSIKENYSFYYFSDFIGNLFGSLLPSSWNPGIETSNYQNSYFLLGKRVKSIPPGLIAQGFYSLGVVGVIIISYSTGRFIKFIDYTFKEIIKINSSFIVFYAYFITSSLNWVRTGLPANYFYDTVFLSTIIFLSISFKYLKK